MQSKALQQHDTDAGCYAYDPRATGEVRVWIAAIRLYAQDAITAAFGRNPPDAGRALRDLRSIDQRSLKTLCEPLAANPEVVTRAIEKCIARGYGAGIAEKPKPKRQRKAA
jgi:hypothetical protein